MDEIPLQIVLRQPEEFLLTFAAEELQRYVRKLFGFTPPLICGELRKSEAAATAILGGPTDESLSNQGYAIRPLQIHDNPGLRLTGGSPRAILWAAYELISAWGIRFLVQGDIFPEDTAPFHLPPLDIHREPVFPRREFRVINDMANSGVFWSLDQHKNLFDQLTKLRFTGILIATYPHQPWAHYSFRGIERCSGDLCYGWKHRIHSGTIGRELFGNAAIHTNPDFQGAETYEERLACGHRLMCGIFDAARSRGLEVTYVHPMSEFPDEFALALPELSADVELPDVDMEQFHYSRHGLTFIGGPADREKYRSPLNPVYIDLTETSLIAHIQAYPDADRYGLWEQEFPPGGAGVEACWQALDERHDVGSVISLEEIEKRASKQFFYAEGRALAQARGAIQSLRLYDILVNERRVLDHSTNPDAKMRVFFFSEHVQPLVEKVLPPDRCEFIAVVDYLPARVAERMHTLEFARRGKLDVLLTTTIEDDNVGFLPQLVTPSLHAIVEKMREFRLKGFCFRQFDISQHEPSMAYMAEAAWDPSVTPDNTYRRYARDVAGKAAADDLIAAFRQVEELTESANALMGLGFMFPNIYRKHWGPGSRPDPSWREYIDRLAQVEQHLQLAFEKCALRGRRLIDNYLHFVRFAGQFLRTMDLIRQARAAYDQAREKQENGDPVAYHPLITRASGLLFQAESASAQALRTWASQAADPTDLGTLAGLNAYGHDWLRGKCVEVYWESQQYGFTHVSSGEKT